LGSGEFVLMEVSGNPVDVTPDERYYVMFVRRAEDVARMQEATRRLTLQHDVEDLLAFLPDQLRWRHDGPRTTIVWEDEQGARRAFGDELPAELVGLLAETDETSPWRAAWHGEEQAGAVQDLPAHLAAKATDEGLGEYHVLPISNAEGQVRALLTLWGTEGSLPLPMFESIARSMCQLVLLTLNYGSHLAELVHHADHDGLTGLLNRRRFYDELARTAADDDGDAGQVAVLYVDLDAFKPINDEFGHIAGDIVLVEVARRHSQCVRADDLVARLGGDEFAVLCRGCSAEEAALIADRFLEALAEPVDLGDASVAVHASVGLALGSGDDGDRLALRADEAMYRAKRSGGRQVAASDT
jgi:diguanylate cyclase (GGDEF)-like protein